ncbi:MAG TPA: twin-arginine translocation signal domain-containing protein, partial [Myxococcota bacterium]|nr:twin-arginine translocation signal domain-containing protein [Myxococcota bacterium]
MSEPREPIDRRAFLGHAGVLGAAVAGGLPVAGGALEASAVSGQGTHPIAAAGLQPFELEEISVAELQAGMTSGRYTARRVVELYLQRIAAMDRQGASLHAIIETNP